MKLFSVLLALTLTSACSFISNETVTAMNNLDPATADPEIFRIRFRLPEGLGFVDGGAKLVLGGLRTDTDEAFEETYVLERTEADGQVTFSISETDIAKMRIAQAKIREWDAVAEDETEFSLGFDLAGCLIGNGPEPDAVLSTMLSLNNGETYLPLITQAPISKALSDAEIAKMPPC